MRLDRDANIKSLARLEDTLAWNINIWSSPSSSKTFCTSLLFLVPNAFTLSSVFRRLNAMNTTGWELNSSTFLSVWKIPRINLYIHADPRSISTARCEAMLDHTRSHKSHIRINNSIGLSSFRGCLIVECSFGTSKCVMQGSSRLDKKWICFVYTCFYFGETDGLRIALFESPCLRSNSWVGFSVNATFESLSLKCRVSASVLPEVVIYARSKHLWHSSHE